MKIHKIVIIAAFMAVTSSLQAAEPAINPQALYLQAGKEERSGSAAKAREIYETIIDRFPESDFAVKANDRLLAMPAAAKAPADAQSVATAPDLFAPAPEKPLPDDPKLRKAVEAARLKAKAEITAREEFLRLKRIDYVREGRKQNRSQLLGKEALWQQAAERKVVEQYGQPLGEISSRLDAACKEAGFAAGCSEEDLMLKAPAAMHGDK